MKRALLSSPPRSVCRSITWQFIGRGARDAALCRCRSVADISPCTDVLRTLPNPGNEGQACGAGRGVPLFRQGSLSNRSCNTCGWRAPFGEAELAWLASGWSLEAREVQSDHGSAVALVLPAKVCFENIAMPVDAEIWMRKLNPTTPRTAARTDQQQLLNRFWILVPSAAAHCSGGGADSTAKTWLTIHRDLNTR